jgi:hypothetical protein
MPETGIGTHAITVLGALPRFIYPSDVEPSDRWFAPGTDLVTLDMADDGTVAVPRVAGLETLGVGQGLERLGKVVWESR